MRLILRTLTILIAALLVVAGTLTFAQSSYGSTLLPGGSEVGQRQPPANAARPATDQAATTDASASTSSAAPVDAAATRPARPNGGGPGGFALAEVGKNLVTIAGMVAVVAIVTRFWPRRRLAPAARRAPPLRQR